MIEHLSESLHSGMKNIITKNLAGLTSWDVTVGLGLAAPSVKSASTGDTRLGKSWSWPWMLMLSMMNH